MKKIKFHFIIAILTAVMLVTGCKKDKDDDTPDPVPEPALSSTTNPEVSMKIDGTATVCKNGPVGIEQGLSTTASVGTKEFNRVSGSFHFPDIN